MANQNFRVKKGLEVGFGGTYLYAEETGVGINSTSPRANLDVRGELVSDRLVGIATTTVGITSRALDITGFSTFSGDVYITGNLDVDGRLDFDSFEAIEGNVTGILTTQDFQVNGISTFVGASNFGDINVAGVITAQTGDFDFANLQGDNMLFTGVGTFSGQLNANNLNVTGLSTFAGIASFTDALVDRNLEVSGITSLGAAGPTGFTTVRGDLYVGGDLFVADDIVYDEISGRNLNISGVATIANAGIASASIDDAQIGVATITNADIAEEQVGVSTIALADITDAAIGVATIGFSTTTDAYIGVATVSELNVSDLDVDQDLFVGRDLYVTGVTTTDTLYYNTGIATSLDAEFIDAQDVNVSSAATVAYANITQEQVGVSTIALADITDANIGVATIALANITDEAVGVSTVAYAVVTDEVVGTSTITYADVTEASIGIATVAYLDAPDALLGVSTVGFLTVTGDSYVAGLSTFVGVSSFKGDVYIDGDLFVTDDIVYDEITGRNLNISGLATVNNFIATGVSTIADADIVVAGIETATIDHAIITDEQVGVSTIALANIADAVIGVATIGFSTTTDAYIGVATVSNLNVSNLDVDEDLLVGRNLDVTGITSTDHLVYNTAVGSALTVGILSATDGFFESISFNSGGPSGPSSSTGITSEFITTQDLYVTGIATFTTGVTTQLYAENISVGVGSIFDATLGFATVTDAYIGVATVNDIYVENLLYDANSNVGAADSILATVGGKLTWTRPDLVGIATGFDVGNTYYVSKNGSDSNSGVTPEKAWKTIGYALSQIADGTNNVLQVTAGEYEETFPLSVPDGLTIKGAGQRSVFVRPTVATEREHGFLMGDASTVEDLTIGGQYRDSTTFVPYAFKFRNGATIANRSPYVQRVTVLNKGSVTTAADPYGFDSADSYPATKRAGGGVLADGSELSAGSLEAGFLLNEVTFFVPNNIGVEITNGARVELLSSFVYFASKGIEGVSDRTTGLYGAGQTRLRIDGTFTGGNGDTVSLLDPTGTTIASGTIDTNDGTYVTLTDDGTGTFVVPPVRKAQSVAFVDSAQISTAQARFGVSSLDVTGGNTDCVTVTNNANVGFDTADFTMEFWLYPTSNFTNDVIIDCRDGVATDDAISVIGNGSNTIEVYVGTTLTINGAAAISLNSWTHIAISRESGTLRLFVNGAADGSAALATDLGSSVSANIGADFQQTGGVGGYIDEVRFVKGFAIYTSAFTPPASALKSVDGTCLLLHFDGTNGSTETSDDVAPFQDIRLNGTPEGDKIELADYSQFGGDLRSISCAVEYGQEGVVGDGVGVGLRLFAINFNHVGANGRIDNDPLTTIQANEVLESNGAEVSYVSIDQGGDFRVGESFYVNQETGEVSFTSEVTDLTSLSSLTITDGTNSSIITPSSGRFGNIIIAGNQIESSTGDIDITPAGLGEINMHGNVNVAGILTAQVIEISAIQQGDTSIALDDTGSDGTIRFNTDGAEAMRLDNQQRLGIGTVNVRADLDVIGQTQLEELNVTGIATVNDLDVTTSLTGVATITTADITDANIGVATVGFATITDGFVGVLTVTSFTNLGGETSIGDDITTRNLEVTGLSTFAGVSTFQSDLAVGGDVQVAGASTFVGVATFQNNVLIEGGLVVEIGIAAPIIGINTALANEAYIGIASVGIATATDLLVGGAATITTATITDEVVGTSTITTAEITTASIDVASIIDASIGVATVGFATVTDGYVGVLTVTSFTNLGGETSIGDDITTRNLDVTGVSTFAGIATFNSDVYIAGDLYVQDDIIYDEITGRNLSITGVATIANAGIASASIDDAQIGVATITTLEGTDATVGFATVTDAYIGLATIATVDISSADVENANIGVATVGFATITDGYVGVLTVSSFTNLGGETTIGDDITTRNLEVTGVSTVAGVATFQSNVFVDGNLSVIGDINLDEATLRNLNVTGVGTIAQLGVSTFSATDASVGAATVGFASITDTNIGVATVGILSATSLDIEAIDTDYIVSNRLSVGLATITNADIGVSTVGYTTITEGYIGILTADTVNAQSIVLGDGSLIGGGLLQTGNLIVSGVATATVGVITDLSVSGVATVGYLTATQGYVGILTVESITNGTSTLGDDLEVRNIDASGIATVGFLTASDAAVGGALTVYGNLDVLGDITYDEVSGRNLNISGIATIGTLGVTTDLSVGGFTTTTDAWVGSALTAGSLETLTNASVGADLDVQGQTTLVGFTTSSDLWVGAALTVGAGASILGNLYVGGNATIEGAGIATEGGDINLNSLKVAEYISAGSSIGAGTTVYAEDLRITGIASIPTLEVDSITVGVTSSTSAEFETLTVTGVSSVGFITATQGFVGILTADNLTVTDTLKAESGALVIEGGTVLSGVTTIGENSITLDGRAGREYIELGTGSGDRITGVNTTTGEASYVSVGEGRFYNSISVTGVGSTSSFSGDVEVLGNLSVSGDITYDEVSGRNLNITGLATIGTLGVTTDLSVGGFTTTTDAWVGSALTVAGTSQLGFVTATSAFIGTASTEGTALTVGAGVTILGDLYVRGVSSINGAGIATIGGDVSFASVDVVGFLTAGSAAVGGGLTVYGDLDVIGDITYDEVSGRNLSISGVATIGNVSITTGIVTASSGVVTYYGSGTYLNDLDSAAGIVTSVEPLTRDNGDDLRNGDLWFDSSELRQYTYYVGLDTNGDPNPIWVDSNPQVTVPYLNWAGDSGDGEVNLNDGIFTIVGDGNATYTAGIGSTTITVGIATTVGTLEVTEFTVGSLAGTAGTFQALTVPEGGTVSLPGIAYLSQDAEFANLTATGITTLGVTTASDLTVENFVATGSVTLPGIPVQGGIATFSALNVSGITTLGITTVYDKFDAQGEVVLGSELVDEIHVFGTFRTDLVPFGGDVDLGSSINRWRSVYLSGGFIDGNDNTTITGISTASMGDVTITDLFAENLRSNSGIVTVFTAETSTLGVSNATSLSVGILTATTANLGITTVTELDATGSIDITSNLNVGGITTVGFITATSAAVAGNLDVNSALNVTGAITGAALTATSLSISGVGIITTLNANVVDTVSAFIDSANITTAGITGHLDAPNSTLGISTITTANITTANVGFVTATDMWVSGMLTAQDVNSLSDRRIKENIRPIDNALDSLSRINGVKYDFKTTGKPSMGVIAQEVEAEFPELVGGGDDLKSVNYNGLIGLLIESVKELQQQNETLRAEIEELKNK